MSRRPLIALMLSVAAGLTAAGGTAVTTAWAACGGGPCACGDTVDSSTTLKAGVDPVCSTGPADTCSGVGLFVGSRVALNLGGCTIRGAVGSGQGISVDSGSLVRNGRIVGFGGPCVESFGNHVLVSRLDIRDCGQDGIFINGDSNRVEKSIVRNAGTSRLPDIGNGVSIFGDDNVVSEIQAIENGYNGVGVQGSGNTVEKTRAFGNAAAGIAFFTPGNNNSAQGNNLQDNLAGVTGQGDGLVIANNTILNNDECGVSIVSRAATVKQNQVRYNGTGLCLDGADHTVSLNAVSHSAGDGISVTATGSLFERNTSSGNGSPTDPGFGIADSTQGSGTGGTANTYTGNICRANQAGPSDPGGLCK